jgi:hypothetical protein
MPRTGRVEVVTIQAMAQQIDGVTSTASLLTDHAVQLVQHPNLSDGWPCIGRATNPLWRAIAGSADRPDRQPNGKDMPTGRTAPPGRDRIEVGRRFPRSSPTPDTVDAGAVGTFEIEGGWPGEDVGSVKRNARNCHDISRDKDAGLSALTSARPMIAWRLCERYPTLRCWVTNGSVKWNTDIALRRVRVNVFSKTRNRRLKLKRTPSEKNNLVASGLRRSAARRRVLHTRQEELLRNRAISDPWTGS